MHLKKQPRDHILRNRAIGDGKAGGKLITLFSHLSKEVLFPPLVILVPETKLIFSLIHVVTDFRDRARVSVQDQRTHISGFRSYMFSVATVSLHTAGEWP